MSNSRRKLAAFIVGVLIAVLLLGIGILYPSPNSPSPRPSNATDSSGHATPPPDTSPTGTASTSPSNPPVGYDIQQIPSGFIPNTTILTQELSRDQQVHLLITGGTHRIPTGITPAILLQYSCTDCPSIVSNLTAIANKFNQNGRWVYVAPYTEMNATIAVSAYRQLSTMNTFNRAEIEQSICTKLKDQPLRCREKEFSFGNTTG